MIIQSVKPSTRVIFTHCTTTEHVHKRVTEQVPSQASVKMTEERNKQ